MKAFVSSMGLVLAAACAAGGVYDGVVFDSEKYLSPSALAVSPDKALLYVAESDLKQIAVVDLAGNAVAKTFALPAEPTGLAVSSDGARLFVTCASPAGSVVVIDTAAGTVSSTIAAGNGATAPVLSPDNALLYVCNRFLNNVAVIDVATGGQVASIAVPREPIAAALTPDGAKLIVANHLPAGRSDVDYCAANVSIIDTASRQVAADIVLPNGSGGVRGLALSPDGAFAYVAHILGRFHMPTTQLERGWMNTNAMSIVDVAQNKLLNTVLLDDVDNGASNPWGVAVTPCGKYICVTHAGTHELSVIDWPALQEKLARLASGAAPSADYTSASNVPEDVPNDLSFLVGVRRRIQLQGNGPRAVAAVGMQAYVAEYFSGTLAKVDLTPDVRRPVTPVALGEEPAPSKVRLGQRFFNDASLCFQGWQSCASCHPDARMDALN
ncbi:MAG: hypothetical protein QG656_2668, partial [Candidatus Hydrogenedentes bacterium]|nr:hypothetical protein [Candidatus Hydrogenedentota bacterium]